MLRLKLFHVSKGGYCSITCCTKVILCMIVHPGTANGLWQYWLWYNQPKPLFCFLTLTFFSWHRENMPTWLPWPRFKASLDPVAALNAFRPTLLIVVIEIRFNFQIYVQCAEKIISKITFNIRWNLEQLWRSRHTWVSKGNIKGLENTGVWVAW